MYSLIVLQSKHTSATSLQIKSWEKPKETIRRNVETNLQSSFPPRAVTAPLSNITEQFEINSYRCV